MFNACLSESLYRRAELARVRAALRVEGVHQDAQRAGAVLHGVALDVARHSLYVVAVRFNQRANNALQWHGLSDARRLTRVAHGARTSCVAVSFLGGR